MKSLLLLPLLLLAAPVAAQTQPTMPTSAQRAEAAGLLPTKGVNAVVLTATDSVAGAWRTVRELLLTKGYSLAQSDESLHAFTTAPKVLPGNRQLTVTGFVRAAPGKQAEVVLSGFYSRLTVVIYSNTAATVSRPATWEGGAFGEDTIMFKFVQALALSYPHLASPPRYRTL